MILRSISLSHVRCFRNPITVGTFGDGINILYGPNESGKSTLLEAAALALLDRYKVGGEDVESFVPWDTSLSPEITLEFEANGKSYRLMKTFLSGNRALLAERVNGAYQDLHEGEVADTTVRGMLLGELPGRGRARPEHWGILRLLWSLQAPGGQNDHLVTQPVADRLRGALGGAEIRTYLGEIARRVDGEHRTIFQPERGGFRDGSPVRQLRDEVTALAAQAEQAREALEQVQQWAERLEALGGELGRLEEERTEAEGRAESYRDAVRRIVELRGQIALAEARLAEHNRQVSDLQRRLDGYHEQTSIRDEAREEWRKLSTEQRRLHDQIASLEDTRKELQVELGESKGRLASARLALRRAQQIEKARSLQARVESLEVLLRGLGSIASQLEKAEKQLAETAQPAEENPKEAARLEAACHRLRAQVESLGIWMKVTAKRRQAVAFTALDGGLSEERSLESGEETEFAAGGAALLALPGVLEVHVRSGSTDAAVAREELDQHQTALRDLLSPFGVATAADLAALAERVKALQKRAADLRTQLAERAAPYKDENEARQHLVELRNQLDEIEPSIRGGEPVDVKACEREVTAAEKRVETITGQVERNGAAVQIARDELAEVKQGIVVCESRRNNAEERATEYLGEFDDERGLAGALRSEEEAQQKAAQDVGELNAQLPPPEADPELLMDAATEALEEIESRGRKLQDEQAILADRIRGAESLGRYEALNTAEERLAAKRRQLERELTRAVAIRLLLGVLRARRQGTTSEALRGLEANVSRILSAVTARSQRHVRVAPDFTVPGISPIPEGDPVRSLRLLSAGTQEQLWMSVRIALGETYAEKYGRQVMVLDDVLVYTDPGRHDRMLQVLRRAADRLQIFIVTSHPARYRGVAKPEFLFDIGALV